jgi:WD40 repeat protein
MEKLATLTGHTFRVLYLAMNPDGSSIVTGAGDETLRFWNIFPKARSTKCGPLGKNRGPGVVGSGNSSLFPSNFDFR